MMCQRLRVQKKCRALGGRSHRTQKWLAQGCNVVWIVVGARGVTFMGIGGVTVVQMVKMTLDRWRHQAVAPSLLM